MNFPKQKYAGFLLNFSKLCTQFIQHQHMASVTINQNPIFGPVKLTYLPTIPLLTWRSPL